MRFEFATATRIIFGDGTSGEVGSLAAEMGSSAFVITGRTVKRAIPLLEQLNKKGIKYTIFSVSAEPTTSVAKAGIEQARQAKSDRLLTIYISHCFHMIMNIFISETHVPRRGKWQVTTCK